jgi:hypothetical protein
MPHDLGRRLRETIQRELPCLEDATLAPGPPGAWSTKEELGHLIDSAANNHIRFVLASIDGEFEGRPYAQDAWVEAHAYRDFPWPDLVDLWYRYNLLLAHLIERIPDERMRNRCTVGGAAMTLDFVIADYIVHMQHHLDHLLRRDVITPYPALNQATRATDPMPFVSG